MYVVYTFYLGDPMSLIVTAIWFVALFVSMSILVLETGLAQKLTLLGKVYMMTG